LRSRSRIQNRPFGVTVPGAPTPIRERQIRLPRFRSVAVSARRSIVRCVSTSLRFESCSSRTQPVRPLGRPGMRICSQARSASSSRDCSTT
jgi:hypothetical protein